MRLFSPKRPPEHLPAALRNGRRSADLRHNVLGLRHGLDRAGRFTVAARHVHVQQGQRKPFALAARPRQMGKEIAMPQEPGQRIGTVEHAVVLLRGPRSARSAFAPPEAASGVVGLKRPRGIAKVQDLRHGFRFTDFQQDDLAFVERLEDSSPEPPLTA